MMNILPKTPLRSIGLRESERDWPKASQPAFMPSSSRGETGQGRYCIPAD